MRNSYLLILVTALSACTGSNMGGGGGGGSGGTGGAGGSGGGGGADPNGAPVFEITNPDILVSSGQEVTYCYYFHTSNTETVAINKWVSAMTPGSHHMIMFLNPGGTQPADGTVDQNCGVGGGGGANVPVWTYATQTPTQEEDLPADDGAGKPLAQNVAPNSAGYFQMHYLNATQAALMVHVDLKAYALAANVSYTQTAAYVTYNNDISIGPGKTGVAVTASCPVPAGVKFWTMSTHSHKQSVGTDVMDGTNMLFYGHRLGAPRLAELERADVLQLLHADADVDLHVQQHRVERGLDDRRRSQRADQRDVHGDGLLLPGDRAEVRLRHRRQVLQPLISAAAAPWRRLLAWPESPMMRYSSVRQGGFHAPYISRRSDRASLGRRLQLERGGDGGRW